MKVKIAAVLTLLIVTAVSAQALDSSPAQTEPVSPLFRQAPGAVVEQGFDQQRWNEATVLPTNRNAFEMRSRLAFALTQSEETGAIISSAPQDELSEKKNPGRALMLSAILPGAGELYAGSKLKAAFFFALEVTAWYGAVTYALRGDAAEQEFEDFADGNYQEGIYRAVELSAAVDSDYEEGAISYTGTSSEWSSLTWQEKQQYLPENFTHELSDEHDQSYYENIGKYMTQFGYGWSDWITAITDAGSDPVTWAGAVNYNWASGGGVSSLADKYISMRGDTNDLLDNSAMFFSVIMVNHVISALDAGFTVRSHNRKFAELTPATGQIWHNNEPVVVAGLNVRF